MNKRLHRIVFNAARGMRMVVQETARSAGKATGATSGVLATALAGLLAVSPAPAQIVGAPGVAPNLRPTVLVAPNGVPLVNIQTPSAAGVSRNLYHQFDVSSRGVILHNSRTDVQTQLGGWVQGNPYLATGPARVILNEITSGNPTQLRGAIEVGGQRAEVIVANPAGIAVDGGTFINASRATLTTGTPQLNAFGGLDGYVVRGGTVSIDGAGLDARSTDYTAILARAAQINAGLWANELKVVTGANQVSADHTQAMPTTGTGTPPVFALDVSHLGGMYAGKIHLIGTEAGLGARNAGTIQAASGGTLAGPGEFVVTAAGRLENIGTMQATSRGDIAAQSLANSGRIAAGQELRIATQGTLGNAGGTLEAQSLQLVSAGDLDNRGGTMRQTSGVGLTVAAPRLSNTEGGVIGAEPVPETPTQPGAGTGTGTSSPTTPETGAGETGTGSSGGGTVTPSAPSYVPAPGTITASGSVLNDGGRIYAGGPIQLQTPQVNNSGGSITTTGLAASGPSFSNAGGTLHVTGRFSANVDRFDNTGGLLSAGSLQIASSGDLLNTDGTLASDSHASLDMGGLLNNGKGSIQAATDLSVQAGSLTNSGTLRAGNDTTVDVSGALVNDGSITAGRHTTITAGSVQGTGVLGASIQADGQLGSTGDLRVTSTGALEAKGTNLAAGSATLQGASIDLSASTTSATNIALSATQGHVTTSGATLTTPGMLSVAANSQASQTLVNQGGKLNAAQLSLAVSNLANTNGGEIVQTGTGATTIATSGAIDNSGGRIATNAQDLTLDAAAGLTNTGGKIEHAGSGTLRIAGSRYSGAGGELIGNGALIVNVAGAFDQDGGSTSAKQITIDAGALSNQGGRIVQATTADTRIRVVGALNNDAGTIASNGHTTIAAGSLSNQGGTIRAAESANLGLAVAGLLDNSGQGEIGSGGAVALNAGSLQNDTGRITAVGDLGAAVTGTASNHAGTLAANGNTTLSAASLDNHGGTVAAVNGKLDVTTSGTTTNAGGSLQAGGATVLINAGLDNTQGKVFGSSVAVDAGTGALANALGTIAATTTVDLQSGALNNGAGLIQSGAAMVVNTHGQQLTNTHAAGHTTGQGGITSGGTLTLDSGTLDNTAGFIGAKEALVANTGAVTNGLGGLVFGQDKSSIDTHGAAYDNRGGQTLAVGDLSLAAGAVTNSAGLIRSGATTTLRASSLDNTATSAAEQGIEGRNVAITTAGLANAAGAIRADANATLTSAVSIDNSAGGLISAGDTLSLIDPNAATPAAKTLTVQNTGSTLLAGQALTVDAAALSFDGRLLSKGDMRLALNQDVVIAAGSETLANRDLSLSTSGNLANSGKLAAGRDLRLAARHIDNAATGDIQGATTTLAAAETITNRGVIDGVLTRIDAATLTNIGTGRIYGDQIAIGAGTLNNLAETVNGVTSAATIAARARLDIGAGTLHNRDGALIFSDGDLAIGGSLDASGRATGAAASLNNHASTLEATRHASIATAVLNNTNGGVTWTLQPGASRHVVEYAVSGSATRYPASEVLLAVGGYLPIVSMDNAGWSNWVATDASNPLAPGNNAAAKLLLPSPDHPLARFRPYYLQSPINSADRSYRTCNVDTCETTAMPGAWYAVGDPIWATFGVAPPAADLPANHPGRIDPQITVGQEGLTTTVDGPSGPTTVMLQRFDHPVTQAEYDQWQAYRTAHEALDVATLRFIHTITGVARGPDGDKPPRLYSIYDAFDYTVTSSTPVLQSSAPARILAGGAMSIQVASGTNDMSQILAGGALTVTGGAIANVGLMVDAPTVQTGTAIHSYVQNDNRTYQFAPYDLTAQSTVTLAAARQEGNVSFAGSGAGTGSLSPGQTGATTQGAGNVQGTRVNPIVQVPSAVGGIDRVGGGGAGAATGPAGAPGNAPVPVVVRTSTPNAAVPTASLFRTHPEPASRYLVETDPRFASHRLWLSSDYLLNALGSAPNLVQKRLGDGYYEQRLIREQVAQLTGHRYLDGFDSDDAQYTALMNAGATFAKEYGLRPGVALTAAQMAQLTSDIVWLIEQEVSLPDGSTQKVLVPQVYVRVKEGDIDGSGALLAGRSVNMRLAGDLTTAGGTIAGREAVVISAENIHNLGGRITAQDALLVARQDLHVIGGTIDAANSLAAIAGRDINVVSTTRQARSDSGMLLGSDAASGVKLAAVTLDRVAGLYVTNPGGSLLATAGRDMNLVGAEVQSGGDASLSAGRDLNLDSVTTGRAEDIRWSGKNSREGQQSQETGTTVSGAGSVRLQAGRDLSGRAATLSAGETLRLDAGGKLTLSAGENQSSAETHHATGKGMTKYSLDADSQDTTLARTRLSGKDIELRSGGDMTLSAIEANAERMDIRAGGRLHLLTQSTTSAMSGKEVDNDAAFSSASGSGRTDETTQYNRFNVKELGIRADGGIRAQIGQNDSLASLAQQPGMGWVNQLANDPAFVNSVEWQRVREEHDRWSYHQSGMGPVTALVVSVVAAAVAAPMAAQAGAAAGGSAAVATGEGVALAGGGVFMGASAPITAGVSAAVQAGVTALASRAAVSLVNNDGDLGRVLQEMGSSDAVKGIVSSMLTAGVIDGLGASGLLPGSVTNATDGSARFTDQLQRQLIDNVAGAVVRSAVNGTSLENELRDGLVNALLNTVAAQGALEIGEVGPQGSRRLDAFASEVTHAILGCAVGAGRASVGGGEAATGCSSGAIGAVVGNLAAEFYDPHRQRDSSSVSAFSQTMAGIAGALVGGDVSSAHIAALAGGNAVENNRQLHYDEKERIRIAANGDTSKEERLRRAACYENKCWAQYPEGSDLYRANFVSASEAAGLLPELAWVKEEQKNGRFEYTAFQRGTDAVAAATGMASGTFNGQPISSLTGNRPPCSGSGQSTDCAAGIPNGGGPGIPDGMYTVGTNYSLPLVGSIRFAAGVSLLNSQWDVGFLIDNDVLGVNLGHYYLARGSVDLSYQMGDFRSNNGEFGMNYRIGAGQYGLGITRSPERLNGASIYFGSQLGFSVSGQETRTWSIRRSFSH